jgi:dephospho-CoA kinase
MIVLGLTGSIGMGKSTVAAMFAEQGIPVFDADATVRALQGPGGALIPAIEAMFPGTTSDAGLDREKLGKAVFGDREALKRLESLVHPAVNEARQAFFAEHRDAALVVLDIPLLFETGGDSRVDKVVVVSAPPEIQRERVLRRPGMTAERFESILALQMPDAEKRAWADHVINTGGPLEETRAQVNALIACLIGGTGG